MQHQLGDIKEYSPGSGLPQGTNNADLLSWDATSGKFVISARSGIADGDIAKYDSATKKWVKLTPSTQSVVTDVQYDNSSHVFQKKTCTLTVIGKGSVSGWTTITGGSLTVES